MWIILLDHSGSMGDPFEATDFKFEGRVRKVAADIKLDAAKKPVLLQLRRLGESTHVVLFGFTSTVRQIHAGQAGEHAAFEQALSG